MVRVSSPAKLRPWSELTAKMVMGVVPGLAKITPAEAEGGSGQPGATELRIRKPSLHPAKFFFLFFLPFRLLSFPEENQDTFDHDKGQKSVISGNCSEFPPVDFPFPPGFLLCSLVGLCPKSGENCPISRRRKRRSMLPRLWLSWFFGPEKIHHHFCAVPQIYYFYFIFAFIFLFFPKLNSHCVSSISLKLSQTQEPHLALCSENCEAHTV